MIFMKFKNCDFTAAILFNSRWQTNYYSGKMETLFLKNIQFSNSPKNSNESLYRNTVSPTNTDCNDT